MAEVNEKATPKLTAQDFAKEYQALCERTGFVIVANPKFIPTNHGTYELSVDMVISEVKQ